MLHNDKPCHNDEPFFLHDWSWISPWIKLISTELDITINVIVSQLSGYCDFINNRLWRHQQNVNPASEARGRCVKISILIVIIIFVMSCKKLNNVCTLELLRNSGNKHQNNPLVSAETVCHLSTYIILYQMLIIICPAAFHTAHCDS